MAEGRRTLADLLLAFALRLDADVVRRHLWPLGIYYRG